MDGKITVLDRYNVYIGSGILPKLRNLIKVKNYSSTVLITDNIVKNYCLKEVEKVLPKDLIKIILRPGEQFKSIETVQNIWQELLANGCDRKTLVINLGGGAISDIGGFTASTYMRGIDFLQIPTTLLSQIDASIGGKVGINFGGIKNLIGVFSQPIGVICDIKLLSSLPDREFIAGFSEILKHGLIADKKYFEFASAKKPREFTKQELTRIVFKSIRIKTDIIGKDEKEADDRRLLNFGHTVGHAVESLSLETQTPLLHGEAISVGIITEAKISFLLKLISASDLKLIEQSLYKAGLPITVSKMKAEEIIKKMQSDKKNEDGKINFTLLQNIGKAIINQTTPLAVIKQALKQTLA